MRGFSQLTRASARMVYRSPESLRVGFVTPIAFAALMALYQRLHFQTGSASVNFFDYIVTGVAAWYVTYTAQHGMTGTAAGYRAQGVLRRIAVTPISAGAFISGQALARVGLAVAQSIVVLGVGALLGAHIKFGANFAWELVPVTMVVLAGLSIGFIWAGVTNSPEGANLLDVMTAIPILFLAGAFWPRDSYSQLLQHITDYAIPFVPMFDMLRGIALHGNGITQYSHDLLVGGAWLAALFLIATRVYRLTED